MLHRLAEAGVWEVINHPEVQNIREYKNGYTPLHIMAMNGDHNVVFHDSFRHTLDFHSLTPYDYYVNGDVKIVN